MIYCDKCHGVRIQIQYFFASPNRNKCAYKIESKIDEMTLLFDEELMTLR